MLFERLEHDGIEPTPGAADIIANLELASRSHFNNYTQTEGTHNLRVVVY